MNRKTIHVNKLQNTKIKNSQGFSSYAHSENILDDEELLLLFDGNLSTNLDLLYWSYESFDLDSRSEDECKSELRFFLGNMKKLVNILQLPDVLKCNNEVFCGSLKAFCIFLKHFPYLCRY